MTHGIQWTPAGSPQPAPSADGAGVGLALAIIAAVCIAASGCSVSAYSQHATAGRLATIAVGATGEVVDAARDKALDDVEKAHPAAGPVRDAALDAEASRWRPIGQALDAVREVLLSWGTALESARVLEGADAGSVLWPRVLALAARVVALYGRVASLARELGAEIVELPSAVTGLLAGLGGES